MSGPDPVTQFDDLLKDWTPDSRVILRNRLLGPEAMGHIPAGDVARLAQAEHRSVDELMVHKLPVARHYSRPPISSFHVGAVALGASGAIYPGANIEVSGNALNQAVHAEQFAVVNAFANRDGGIAGIAVTAPPCGHCRQFLNEITDAARIRIVVPGQPRGTLGDLLPAPFGPRDLDMTKGMFDTPPAGLHALPGPSDALARAAFDRAARAYAPYSKSPSGCGIAMRSGRVFAGSYIENAAFNPSLSPLQCALVAAILAGEDLGTIQRAVLVEVGATISQRAATEAVLHSLAPGVRLEVHSTTKA